MFYLQEKIFKKKTDKSRHFTNYILYLSEMTISFELLQVQNHVDQIQLLLMVVVDQVDVAQMTNHLKNLEYIQQLHNPHNHQSEEKVITTRV